MNRSSAAISDPSVAGPPIWARGITQIAFLLLIASAGARFILLETIRDPFEVSPGNQPYPRGAGAATSIALNLLCCLPALLILLRRMLDKTYSLRWNWSLVLMLPMTVWMAASIHWSADKFETLVSSSTFIAAMALLWSSVQLVRTWKSLRLVGAAAYGLLLINLVQGFYYKYADLPDLQQNFEQHKEQILRDRGFDPGTFAATQFEKKILSGEMFGFYASANSYAAVLVMLTIIGLGAAIQRLADDRAVEWAVGIALAFPLAIFLLYFTQSKAAIVAPVLGVALLAVIWRFRGWLGRNAKRGFWLGFAIVLAAMSAVVGHGLYHHSLPTLSLLYRWRYWVASWHMFWRNPIFGVGWDNYSLYYLRDRLTSASEEIRDPHNFIVRFFVELGSVGGILMLAWMGRLWWEMSRPNSPAGPAPLPPKARFIRRNPGMPMLWIFTIALATISINMLAGSDFTQPASYITVEFLRRGMFLGAMAIGMFLIAMRSLENPQIDDRPAPWILYGIIVALGVFLIHNLIEFSLFEPGALCFFCVLTGSVLGIRAAEPANAKRYIPGVAAGFLIALAAWVVGLIWIFIPTARAENLAQSGDDHLRNGVKDISECDRAANLYAQAFAIQPLNADYIFRAGRAIHIEADQQRLHGPPISTTVLNRIIDDYSSAIAANPMMIEAYLRRAELFNSMGNTQEMIADFRSALERNPIEVATRLEFANALEANGLRIPAATEYQEALRFNDLLDPQEPKRLSEKEVERYKAKIAELIGKQADQHQSN